MNSNPYEPFSPRQNPSGHGESMKASSPRQWTAVIVALLGLTLASAGLGLAVLSNPQRFSLSVADDRRIYLLAISSLIGVSCGIVLFLFAVRQTTRDMPARCKTQANAGVGIGVALQLVALFLPEVAPNASFFSLPLILGSIIAFLWGASNYAEGKGYSKWLGLLGIIGIVGLVVLILLPHRRE